MYRKRIKALIEELLGTSVKSHDLLRLKDTANMFLPDDEMIILATINEVYIDARYPGDLGLMPQGKPTIVEAKRFIAFSQAILERVNNTIS